MNLDPDIHGADDFTDEAGRRWNVPDGLEARWALFYETEFPAWVRANVQHTDEAFPYWRMSLAELVGFLGALLDIDLASTIKRPVTVLCASLAFVRAIGRMLAPPADPSDEDLVAAFDTKA